MSGVISATTIGGAMAAADAGIAAGVADFGLTGLAATAATTGVEGALVGGGLGALTSGITGGDIGKGALGGAMTGALGGAGGALGGALGGTAGGVIGGGVGGALGGASGAAVTGGNVGQSAEMGGVGGAVMGGLNAPSSDTVSSAPVEGVQSSDLPAPISDKIGSSASSSASGASDTINVGGNTPSASSANTIAQNSGAIDAAGNSTSGATNVPSSSVGQATTGGGGSIGNNITENTPVPTPQQLAQFTPAMPTNNFANAVENVPTASGDAGAGQSLSAVAPQAAGGTTAPAAPTTLMGNLEKGLTSPNALISAGGLAMNAIKGQQALPGQNALAQQAATANAQGAQLQSYLTNGTLPQGVQQSIDQATQSTIASIRSQHAAQGTSGSSAEQQEIASATANSKSQGASIAMQLLQTGINESGLASKLYENMMQNALQQDQALAGSIQNFATAMGGSGSGNGQQITLKLAGS